MCGLLTDRDKTAFLGAVGVDRLKGFLDTKQKTKTHIG